MQTVRLNLGSGKKAGENLMPGFTTVDLFDETADLKMDARALQFENNSVDEIYSSHMIEHLTWTDATLAIKHWYQLLKPGGKLTLRCPNAMVYVNEWLAYAYKGEVKQLSDWGLRNIMGWWEKPGMLHHILFTKELLEHLFQIGGFRNPNCHLTETRVLNKHHFEYRVDGDLICAANK